MTLRKFQRGFDEKEMALTKTFLKTPLGEKIVYHNDSFQICFRDKYLNIYWRGCSILKYSPNAKVNKFLIHHKYTEEEPDKSIKNKDLKDYLRLALNNTNSDLYPIKATQESPTWCYAKLLDSPPDKLMGYAKGEKGAIALFIEKKQTMPNEKDFLLLDLEVAFSRTNKDKKPVADRMDMAGIFVENKTPVLRLIEVKQAKDPRLKSNYKGIPSPKCPEVMSQMKHYSEFLKRERDEGIKQSYKKVAQNYFELIYESKILPETYFPDLKAMGSQQILEEFIKNPVIDPKPYLYIIELKEGVSNSNQKELERGRPGQNHWERLKEKFHTQGYPDPVYHTIYMNN